MQKTGQKEERFFTNDNVLIGMFQALTTSLDPAVTYYDKADFANAYGLFIKAFEQCQVIIKSCEKRKKLAHVPRFRNKLAEIARDIATCATNIDKIPEAIQYAKIALTNPATKIKAADLLIRLNYNLRDYCEILKYLEIDEVYKNCPLPALYNTALCLRHGNLGLTQNSARSLKYLLVVANRFNTDPHRDLMMSEAELYELIAKIYGEMKDPKNELIWRLKAVELKHPISLHNYATMLENGEATKKDLKLALTYYLSAAELGHVDAMNNAAVLLSGKDGTHQDIELDLKRAESLLTIAADQHDDVTAMVNLASLLIENGDNSVETKERIERYLSRGELENYLEARNTRASQMMLECLSNNQPLDEVIEIFHELALAGLASAQYNLAVIFHVFEKGSPSAAIYWYLEAIANGHELSKDNLFLLLSSLAEKMAHKPEEILAFYESTLTRYLRMLPKKERGKDIYVPIYKMLITNLKQGLDGDINELFKRLFPVLHVELHKEIVHINRQISQVVTSEGLKLSEKIKIILEYTLTSAMSVRNKTSAIKNISQIVTLEQQGAEALIENQASFEQLVREIHGGILDNEGFIELCSATAKLRGHPESRFFKLCYDKLLVSIQSPWFTNGLELNPTWLTTLLTCSSELASEHPLSCALLELCANRYQKMLPELKPYQLFRCLQALCVNHASFSEQHAKTLTTTMIVDFIQALLKVPSNNHSPIDLYQGYLSLLYLRRNGILGFDLINAFEQKFKPAFSRMLVWLQQRKSVDIHSSKSQKHLAEFITKYRPKDDVEEEAFKHGLFVDIYLKSNKVIVEFDGPSHFLIMMPEENLSIIRQRKDTFHNRIHGLKVLRVVYNEWQQFKNNASRLEFLERKLLPLGVKLEAMRTPKSTNPTNASRKTK